MLILHPSSCCDVCLDSYTLDIPTQAPHAIPCGHIFCKVCLVSITSSTCPLCRKPFFPNRIVKLHIDRPAKSEQCLQEFELLQRLAAEEAKRQADLEAAVKQSKQRKQELQEAVERARLRQQGEEDTEAERRQPAAEKSVNAAAPTVAPAGVSMSIDEWSPLFNPFMTPTPDSPPVDAAIPPLRPWRPAPGGGWRARQEARNAGFVTLSNTAPLQVNARTPRLSWADLADRNNTSIHRGGGVGRPRRGRP